jgi:hypothetical protein
MTIKEEVLTLMKKGKASLKKGWVMSEILKDISERHGEDGMKIARKFIIEEYCGITEGNEEIVMIEGE